MARTTAAGGNAAARAYAYSDSTANASTESHAVLAGVASSQSYAYGSSGNAAAGSEASFDAYRSVAASAVSSASGGIYSYSQATFGGYVPGLQNTGGGVGAQSYAKGAPDAGEVDAILAGHANVAAALQPGSLQVLGTGAMGAGYGSGATGEQTYYASARYTFTLQGSSGVVVGLLDFSGFDSGTPLNLTFSVDNFGSTLVSETFTSLAGAGAYFSDHALLLGSFSGKVDLTLRFSLTAADAQGADFSYLVASGALANPVPEPAQWALLLTGFGVLGALARRRGVRR